MDCSLSFNRSNYYNPKRLLVIALDKSESMMSCGMEELCVCLNVFIEEAQNYPIGFSSVDLSILAFNQGVEMVCETSGILEAKLSPIVPEGIADIILGVETSIKVVKDRIAFYRTEGYEYYKPWLVLITNYENRRTVDITQLANQIRKDVKNGFYEFLPVGIGNVFMPFLDELKGAIMPIKLQDGRYDKFFSWLNATIGNFSLCGSPVQRLEEMRPRVFISYKRVDKDRVREIKSWIEETLDITCWFDVDGIESDAQFANVIIRAINECEVFLFMYSHAHMAIKDHENDWTIREISFAQKKKKRIVFVNIDGSALTDWFEMMFGSKQQVDANSESSMKKLLLDISNWLYL